MLRVAQRLDLLPSPISYRHTVMLVRTFLLSAWIASPGVLPKRLDQLHQDVALLVLSQRRARRYPRAVKIKMSAYRKKPVPKHSPTLTKPLN